MSDAEDLARRYLHLWQEYLTALMVDPREPKFLEFWIAACSALAENPPPRDPAAVEETWPPGSSPSAAPATGACRERDDVMADLAAALPVLKTVSRPSKVSGRQLCDLAAEIGALGTEAVERAVAAEIGHRTERYLAGLEAYRHHRFRRHSASRPVLWQHGTTRLLDYACDATAPTVLVVPSLIDRYYVLDLLPERSFLQHLVSSGLRPLVIDWQAPGSQERHFDLVDYIAWRLEAAAAWQIANGPIGVVGYCMGGSLALALSLRRQRLVACLTLLATPGNFHAKGRQTQRLALAADSLARLNGRLGSVSVEAIQTLLYVLDPFISVRKFHSICGSRPDGDELAASLLSRTGSTMACPCHPGRVQLCTSLVPR